MYVPAPPAQPVTPLIPVGIETGSTPLVAPTHTKLKVKRPRLDVLDGQRTSIAGTLTPAPPGASIDLQARTRRGWRTIAHTHTGAQGRYRLSYRPPAGASELVRVYFPGDALHRDAHRRVGQLGVYRLAEASWYGGGGTLACGGQLTSSTLGVANKTLPCGTLVKLRYNGRSVRVPVIDRGPFVPGREFDLTEATKAALGFGDTGEVWVS
jgi:peptidoglycan lytic transglycosylase